MKEESIGMIEVLGTPCLAAVADVMVKAAQVTFVGYENIDLGYLTAIVRGNIAEVTIAVMAGVEALETVNTTESPLLSYHVIARPHPNLDYILPIVAINHPQG